MTSSLLIMSVWVAEEFILSGDVGFTTEVVAVVVDLAGLPHLVAALRDVEFVAGVDRVWEPFEHRDRVRACVEPDDLDRLSRVLPTGERDRPADEGRSSSERRRERAHGRRKIDRITRRGADRPRFF